jgi:Cu/Ag efflux protein CusF
MRHQFPGVIAVCLAAIVLSCAHHAQTVGNSSSSKPVKQADENKTFAGSIDRISQKAGMVTVVHWPLYKTFQVGPDCEIVIPGKDNATLEDFHMDDLVMVSYEKVDDVLVATRIARRSEAYIREKQEQRERLEEMLNPTPNQ